MRKTILLANLLLVLLTSAVPAAQNKEEKIRHDGQEWDSINQQFIIHMSCKFGIATASEHANFKARTTLNIYKGALEKLNVIEELNVITTESDIIKMAGATKDQDGYIQIEPQSIPWDREGYVGPVTTGVSTQMIAPSGSSVGETEIEQLPSVEVGPFILIIDDFESYTDNVGAGEAIWQTWIDGTGDPANGSQVGHLTPPYAELDNVAGGDQSMPFFYDNSVGTSFAFKTLSQDRDWTIGGVTTLSMWFRGLPTNSVENLILQLESGGTTISIPYDGSKPTQSYWTNWNINLSWLASTIDLTNVNTIQFRLNAGDGGTGCVYFDEIVVQ